MPFNSAEFVHPWHASKRWQLSYRGKVTFAQVHVGKGVHRTGTAAVAIKLALDPFSQSMARQLVHEAAMMERVARVSPPAGWCSSPEFLMTWS